MIATIPLREKSRQKPYILGWMGRKGVLEDTFPGSFTIRTEPARAPTPGPLIWWKEPDPEKHEKQLFSIHFLTALFLTPFPSRRFLPKPGKTWSRKGAHYIDFFD